MAKKKGKKRRKKTKITFEYADVDQKKFLRVYANLCELDDSPMCLNLKKSMLEAIPQKQYVTKFLICPEAEDDEIISLEPVIKACRETFYEFITELCAWDLELSHRAIAALALFIERRKFKITRLELMDCDIMAFSLKRLSKSFETSILTHINLDYNEFGDEGCRLFCEGCKDNKMIVSLSLCYCELTSLSGGYLSEVINNTRVCELYLDGNKLECEGVASLLFDISDAAEEQHERKLEEDRLKAMMIAEGALQATDRELNTQMEMSATGQSGNESSASKTDKKSKKKKKRKKSAKKKIDPPSVGPYIDVLHLSDNGVDLNNQGSHDALLPCISVFQRLIAHSNRLRELDLSRNSISETSARDILAALEQRKESKLPSLKMLVTTQVSKPTFNQIRSLAGGLSKKKKKGKKKRKKKK